VWCVPVSKLRGVTGHVSCSVKQASERVEILLAQQALLEECGVTVGALLWPGSSICREGASMDGCSVGQASERVEILLSQQALLEECNIAAGAL
jgi:hypothetical protein